MLLSSLIIIPITGAIMTTILVSYDKSHEMKWIKVAVITISFLDLFISLIIWILFNSSSIYFQFIQEQESITYYDFYLGIDGLSIYFILLTTIITPIAIISNWRSIKDKIIYYLSILLLLETL